MSGLTYTQSLDYLNSFYNNENVTLSPKHAWNLKKMRRLVRLFGHPEKTFTPILIAGTKGKGSTGFFLESILKASGAYVGFYSSPHLLDVRERIRVQGQVVSKKIWAETLQTIARKLRRVHWTKKTGSPSYFEIVTLAAMLVFKRAKARSAIFEVGLGGRFDATNVMSAPLVLITPIHYDHEAFLGSTLTKIAGEKAAIIRKNSFVVMSSQIAEVRKVIAKTVRKQKATLLQVQAFKSDRTALLGDFQRTNAAAASVAAQWLGAHQGISVTEKSIAQGLRATGWHGRFEVLKGNPTFVLDAAHNPASVAALVRNLRKQFSAKKRALIFGVSQDKNSRKMLRIFAQFFQAIIVVTLSNPRTQTLDILMTQCKDKFEHIFPVVSYDKALALAKQFVGPQGVVTVSGSFYLLGDIMKRMKHG